MPRDVRVVTRAQGHRGPPSEADMPERPGDVETPIALAGVEDDMMAGLQQQDEDDHFEDASEYGEILPRRPVPRQHHIPHPAATVAAHRRVSTPPMMKPEGYDGTTCWEEYLIYFEQLAGLYDWDDEMKAVMLGLCLKKEARLVQASLEPAQRRSYRMLTTALGKSFAPEELIHLHQAELKARVKRPDESMITLGRDVAKLVRLAFPTADAATREVIGVNAFLDAIPGPASEIKMHVIKGRPKTLQDAVSHATEVCAVLEAESRRSSRRRGDVRMVGAPEDDLQSEVYKLKADLEEARSSLKDARRGGDRRDGDWRRPPRTPLSEITCFGCGEKGHYKRNCPGEAGQGNGSRRLEGT
jgi:hypothetical protein